MWLSEALIQLIRRVRRLGFDKYLQGSSNYRIPVY